MQNGSKSIIDNATPWIDGALREVGRSRTGTISIRRDRPWALVASLPTKALGPEPKSAATTTVWFKANHVAFAHEAFVLDRLDRLVPNTVLRPLARHPSNGWFLADDGGPVADAADTSAVQPNAIVDAYVRVQRASRAIESELVAAGVPMLGPERLLDLFDEAAAHPLAGSAAESCRSLRSQVARACDLLDPDHMVITNSDLKLSHVFVGPPPRLFDWGDAALSHPLVSCGTIERAFGAGAATRYANAWDADQAGPAVRAGTALVDLLNLDVWLRAPSAALDRHPGQIEKLLNRLADALKR